MSTTNRPAKEQKMTIRYAIIVVTIVVFIMTYPDLTFQASQQGISIWWGILFPVMLPVMIMSRFLFRVMVNMIYMCEKRNVNDTLFSRNKLGIWIMLTSLLLGNTSSVTFIKSLHHHRLLSTSKSEYWIAMSQICNPIWIIIVVGVGFFQNASYGIGLACVHLFSAICTIFLFRTKDRSQLQQKLQASRTEFRTYIEDLYHNHADIQSPFGQFLSHAVTNSIQKLLLIGGYIITFSVMIHMIQSTHVIPGYVVASLLEVNIGCYELSREYTFSWVNQLAVTAACLAWGGIASHLQVLHAWSQSGLRYRYIVSMRLIHAMIAYSCVWVGWYVWKEIIEKSSPAGLPAWLPVSPLIHQTTHIPSWEIKTIATCIATTVILYGMLYSGLWIFVLIRSKHHSE